MEDSQKESHKKKDASSLPKLFRKQREGHGDDSDSEAEDSKNGSPNTPGEFPNSPSETSISYDKEDSLWQSIFWGTKSNNWVVKGFLLLFLTKRIIIDLPVVLFRRWQSKNSVLATAVEAMLLPNRERPWSIFWHLILIFSLPLALPYIASFFNFNHFNFAWSFNHMLEQIGSTWLLEAGQNFLGGIHDLVQPMHWTYVSEDVAVSFIIISMLSVICNAIPGLIRLLSEDLIDDTTSLKQAEVQYQISKSPIGGGSIYESLRQLSPPPPVASPGSSSQKTDSPFYKKSDPRFITTVGQKTADSPQTDQVPPTAFSSDPTPESPRPRLHSTGSQEGDT